MTARAQSLFAFSAITLAASPAFACGPSGGELLAFFAFSLAFLFGGLATVTMAIFGRRWHLTFWGWLSKSVGALVAAQAGAYIGTLLANEVFVGFGMDTMGAVAATAPMLTTLAFVLWVRTNRFERAERRAVEPTEAA